LKLIGTVAKVIAAVGANPTRHNKKAFITLRGLAYLNLGNSIL